MFRTIIKPQEHGHLQEGGVEEAEELFRKGSPRERC